MLHSHRHSRDAMVARELSKELDSEKREDRLSALRKVKNQIIGNKHKKKALSGLIPQVVKLLTKCSPDDKELAIQSIVTLGSFGYDRSITGNVNQIVEYAGVEAVLQTLVSASDPGLIDAAARCLKMFYQAGLSVPQSVLQGPVLTKLVSLLGAAELPGVASHLSGSGVAESASIILTKLCSTSEGGALLMSSHLLKQVLQHCVALINSSSQSTCLCALELLGTLLVDRPASGQLLLLQITSCVNALQPQLRSSCMQTRLLAAHCIALLALSCPIRLESLQKSSDADSKSKSNSQPSSDSASRSEQRPQIGRSRSRSAPRASLWAAPPPPPLATLQSELLDLIPGASVLSLPVTAMLSGSRYGNASSSTTSLDEAVTEYINTTTGQGSAVGNTTTERHPSLAFSAGDAGLATPVPAAAVAAVQSTAQEDITMSDAVQATVSEAVMKELSAARRAALPVVLRVVGDPGPGTTLAPMALAALLVDSEELQETAVDGDAVRKCCQILSSFHRHQESEAAQNLEVRSCLLSCLGHMCMSSDAARKSVLESKILDAIQAGLDEDRSPAVRAAAALCVMALTRNVRALRCSNFTDDVAQSLCRLLGDTTPIVRITATAAVCNLVMEFSSIKSEVLQPGGLERLVSNASSAIPELRMYSCWALRNLAHKRDAGVKQAIMQGLGWPAMRCLLCDSHQPTQEQALCLLRNMCMDAPEHITSAYDWGGGDLLAVLEDKLEPTRNVPDKLRAHALYTIVNSLTGPERVKDQVMSSNIPALLLHHMRSSSDAQVRLAAVWCIINLTWQQRQRSSNNNATGNSNTDANPSSSNVTTNTTGNAQRRPANESQHDRQVGGSGVDSSNNLAAGGGGIPGGDVSHSSGAAGAGSQSDTTATGSLEARLRKLTLLGAQESLQALLSDPSMDVRDRAKTALDQLRGNGQVAGSAPPPPPFPPPAAPAFDPLL